MIEGINLLISIFIGCIVFIYYTNALFKPRTKYLYANISIIVGYMMLYAISSFYQPTLNVIAFSIATFVLMYLCFKVTLKNAIIQAFMLTAIMMLAEGVLFMFTGIGIYPKGLLDVSLSARIIHAVLSKLIYFLGIIIAKHVAKGKSKYEEIDGFLSLLAIPFFTIMVIVSIMSVFPQINERIRVIFALIIVFGIIANIINVTPGTTFNLTDQAGRKVEEYYTELYRGFNSSVPEFITRKMRKANRELNYIDGNGNKTTQTEKCDCYKYHLEKGTVVTIDTIESTETYKLQVDEPQDGDIVFQQHENEGEYFIYSDAPEAITDNTLADYAPYAFIREEHLGKGKYTFMSWHLNYSSESAIMDVQLYSENAKIKVNAIGINAPQMDGWDEDWTSPQAILNMEYFKCEKLFKVKTNEYTNRLYGRIDEGYYTLNSKEGYSVWLQDIYNEKIYKNGYNDQILEYPRLPKYDDVVDNQMPFYIIFEFEVLEGEVVLNQMAYNNRENIMSIGENNAPYIGDGAFKGISNTPNEVISDFSYEIKGDEKYIPVRTFNLNNPLGYKSVFWESNVNPQQDATSDISISGVEDGNGNLYKYRVRDIATETELLKFRYVDNSKKDRYDYDTDDNVWYFDEFHDRNYSADSSIAGDVPNRLIATEAALNRYDGENERNKLPIANYSVIETYNIKLKNSTESTKTIEFILDSESCEFLYLENLHKKPVMLSKGSHTRAQVMYYIVLEPNQEIEYKMKTGLFTANDGSMRNCFKIYEGEKDYGEIVGQDGEKHPVHIVNNLHDYDDDWNYPRQ